MPLTDPEAEGSDTTAAEQRTYAGAKKNEPDKIIRLFYPMLTINRHNY